MVVRIQDIVRPLAALDPDASITAAFQTFLALPELDTLAVAREGKVVGIVLRSRLMDLTMSPVEIEVLFRQPVKRFMERKFEAVDIKSSISSVTSKSTTLRAEDPTGALIALKDGAYYGTVPLGRLLKSVSGVNLARARAMKSMAEKLEAAAKTAERKHQEDSRFVAMLGHEIRTPLTGILGVADLLSDTKLDKKQKNLASTIVKSGHHLDRLLDDLLDLSRLKAGKVKLVSEAFDVKEFGRETRSLWQARGAAGDVTLNVNVKTKGGKRLVGDVTRLRQILFNLVSNAIKFSSGGRVDILLETRESRLGRVELLIRVSDTGPGIADEDKARLFEMFEQASPETRLTHGGSGLGLAIAKGLIDRMDGTIGLEDNEAGGAVFTVVCPLAKAGPQLAVTNADRQRSGNFELGRVLIVDDHDMSRFVLKEALQSAGWSVDAVATAEQAKRRLAGMDYQAAIFDLNLGDASGADLLKALRTGVSSNKHIPVLAVSADVGLEHIQACRSAGFDDFVEKPVRPHQVVASLADTIVSQTGGSSKNVRLRAM
ncbi:MAG: ATP-binding protein [Hyphomonadaceae bacterium]